MTGNCSSGSSTAYSAFFLRRHRLCCARCFLVSPKCVSALSGRAKDGDEVQQCRQNDVVALFFSFTRPQSAPGTAGYATQARGSPSCPPCLCGGGRRHSCEGGAGSWRAGGEERKERRGCRCAAAGRLLVRDKLDSGARGRSGTDCSAVQKGREGRETRSRREEARARERRSFSRVAPSFCKVCRCVSPVRVGLSGEALHRRLRVAGRCETDGRLCWSPRSFVCLFFSGASALPCLGGYLLLSSSLSIRKIRGAVCDSVAYVMYLHTRQCQRRLRLSPLPYG